MADGQDGEPEEAIALFSVLQCIRSMREDAILASDIAHNDAAVTPAPRATVAIGRSVRIPQIAAVATCICVAAIALAPLIAAWLDPVRSERWVAIGAVAWAVAIPVLVAVLRGRIDIFEPIYLAFAAFFLYFVYSPSIDLILGNTSFFGFNTASVLPRALWFAAAGLLTTILGYYLPVARVLVRNLPIPSAMSRSAAPVGWVVFAAVSALFLLYIRITHRSILGLLTVGAVGDASVYAIVDSGNAFTNYLVSAVDSFTPAVLLIFASQRRFRAAVWFALLVVVLVYVSLGFRYRILTLGMALVLYHFLRTKTRPTVAQAVLVGSAVAFMIGFIGAYRATWKRGIDMDSGVEAVVVLDAFNRSLDIYQPYAALVDALPARHDFFDGLSYWFLFAQVVPRRLWPEKPPPPHRVIVSAAFGDDAPARAGVFFPNIAEFYANFGMLGVVIGMCFFGIGMRAVYEYAKHAGSSEWVLVWYAIALPYTVQVVSRGYFVQIVKEMVFIFGPIFLAAWISRGPRRLRTSTHS